MKVKYIKVSVADRLPTVAKSVILFIDERSIGLGFLLKPGKWFVCMDASPDIQPTHWLEPAPDREEEMRKMLNTVLLHDPCHYNDAWHQLTTDVKTLLES